ncbi:MAG: anaerobic carbon-monoxide dehydrogenase catalytic subunit [Candidatus Latescibacter sp.]|nr:anaerobic carbon-monoxide dehydrogenase catalytic subunit [Candidatus Latescibacter sp.]
MAEEIRKSIDPTSLRLIEKAKEENLETIWDRRQNQQPQCGFGIAGVCCRICVMGPCRITKKASRGICGATADIIGARNFARMVAAGTAAHSDHARDIVLLLRDLSTGKASDFKIQDPEKLKKLAREFGVETDNKDIMKIARDLSEKALAEFGQQEGELTLKNRAPEKTKEMWRKEGLLPRGIDREITEMMHRTNIGVDNDPLNIIRQAMRVALIDGWAGSMIATDLSDVIFGSPQPIRGRANIGILEKDEVNIIVHGHDPTVSDMIVRAARDPEMIAKAREAGAQGINLGGICCTATEILMRHGIPVAGNFLQQELVIITGAVDLMVVDIQCILPGLIDVAKCFHTEIVTTSEKAQFQGAKYVHFDHSDALATAKKIVEMAIERFKHRDPGKIEIPPETQNFIGGFTAENIFHFLGGRYRATYRPLNNAIMEGRLRGVAAIVGCNHPGLTQDLFHVTIARELLRHDILVVETGCSATACAKWGLLSPEAAMEYAGEGLREICEAVGIPPIIHSGSCVDNSRILVALSNMVSEGGLGDAISDIPVAACAPEWMSEKAVTISLYAVASGIYVDMSPQFQLGGCEWVLKFLTEDIEKMTGGKFAFKLDPVAIAQGMIEHIDKKREALKLRPMMYPVREIAVEV